MSKHMKLWKMGFSEAVFYGKVVIPCAADYGKAKHLHPENFDVPLY
jgi:hypothetical protein